MFHTKLKNQKPKHVKHYKNDAHVLLTFVNKFDTIMILWIADLKASDFSVLNIL